MNGAALRLVNGDQPDGQTPDDRPDRLAEWARFMAAIGNSQTTISGRTRLIVAVMRRSGVDHPDDLTRDHLIGYLASCRTQWTRVTYWRAFRAYDKWRIEFGDLDQLVLTKGITRPQQPEGVARPIDDKTIDRLLALNLTPRPHLYVRLALYQALRVHEIAKVRGEDVDVEGRWLTVLGKGRSHRRIPLHPEVVALAAEMPEVGYWFPVPTAEHVSAPAVSGTIGNALKMAGSNATAHQLRDTAATRMQRQFRDVRVTQQYLRHRNITSTQKYTGVSDEDLKDAVAGLSWGAAAPNAAVPVDNRAVALQLLAMLGVDPSQLDRG